MLEAEYAEALPKERYEHDNENCCVHTPEEDWQGFESIVRQLGRKIGMRILRRKAVWHPQLSKKLKKKSDRQDCEALQDDQNN